MYICMTCRDALGLGAAFCVSHSPRACILQICSNLSIGPCVVHLCIHTYVPTYVCSGVFTLCEYWYVLIYVYSPCCLCLFAMLCMYVRMYPCALAGRSSGRSHPTTKGSYETRHGRATHVQYMFCSCTIYYT